jgi:hypothetical protein
MVMPNKAVAFAHQCMVFTVFLHVPCGIMDINNDETTCFPCAVVQDNLDNLLILTMDTVDMPVRGKKRAAAAEKLSKQASRMRKNINESYRDVPVGAVCLITIDKVDRKKIDAKSLPFVIVVVEKTNKKYWLVCKAGVVDK